MRFVEAVGSSDPEKPVLLTLAFQHLFWHLGAEAGLSLGGDFPGDIVFFRKKNISILGSGLKC
jgi:hypothetical protein